jgi:hypothetical protein
VSEAVAAERARLLLREAPSKDPLWAVPERRLAVHGLLVPLAGVASLATAWMLAAAPLAALVVLAFLPETASRSLEETAPERG